MPDPELSYKDILVVTQRRITRPMDHIKRTVNSTTKLWCPNF